MRKPHIGGAAVAAGVDIKLLRMLVAIDRHGSLTRAAQALGITQSALSHHTWGLCD